MISPPPGTRLILASEDLFDLFGTRTEDGAQLSYEWGEPDANGWYMPTFTRTEPVFSLADEVLFLTSNGIIYDACLRAYRGRSEDAAHMARLLLRHLVIPQGGLS